MIYSDEQALHALATYLEVDHAIGQVATLMTQSTSRIIYIIAYLSFYPPFLHLRLSEGV